ncbi:MerR family transcriptional regulator [Erwinia sp. CPCC 100877]|nr:MerR family transcriptional regulator [Erwinia sp. CPCC 100877]
MEYTIKKVAELSGISSRTLRYYDEINLLKPVRINSSGYRIYGTKEVDRLQQILFYRSLDMKLEDIQILLDAPDFEPQLALEKHYRQLLAKRQQLDQLILTVEKTIRYQKGTTIMTDKEKFMGFKQAKIAQNEKMYGKEIRKKYGEEAVENSNKKWLNLQEEEIQKMENAETELFKALKTVMTTKAYQSAEAKTVFLKHKEWLSATSAYSSEFHRSLGEMYVADERFQAYYDERAGQGAAVVLNQLIQQFAQ